MRLTRAIGFAQLAVLVRPEADDQARGDALAAEHQRQGTGEILAVAFRMAGDELFDRIGGGVLRRPLLQAVAETAGVQKTAFQQPGAGGRVVRRDLSFTEPPRAKRANPGRFSAGQSRYTSSFAGFSLAIQGDWTPSRNAVVATSKV